MAATPGPWEAWAPGRVFVVSGRNFHAVCELNDRIGELSHETMFANARIMAAGPELLEACRMLLKAGEIDGRYLATCQQDQWEKAATLALDAIAKAEGPK